MKRFKNIQEELYVPAKSETLGIPRRKMPQIDKGDMNNFIKFLKGKGATIEMRSVRPEALKATQGNFNTDKIEQIAAKIQAGEPMDPIIASSDGYVMDGHHRWLGHVNADQKIPVYKVSVKAKELLALMHDHPASYTEAKQALSEAVASCSLITRDQMKAFEATVDKLFKQFKIDIDFTNHFRERMGDERNNPCISLKDLAEMIKKIYMQVKAGNQSLKKHKDTEVVIKDLQQELNMPVALEYDRSDDELVVKAKTIMRKKNFTTPNPIVRV